MDALVNGIATSPDTRGVINGTAGSDRISGTAGADHLAGGKGVDYLFGGAGNDTFIIKLVDMDVTMVAAKGVQDFIYDFHGAGVYEAGNNDFIALTGFGAGSTLTLDAARTALSQSYNGGDPTLQFYKIHSGTTQQDYELFVHSTNGHVLATGDYAFYG